MSENILLFELGTEELPPQDLQKLSHSLLQNFIDLLSVNQINYETAYSFATPRRLAFQIINIEEKQPIQAIHKKGPPLKAAFDLNGDPTPAALKFAESCQVPVQKLKQQETPKGTWLFYEEMVPGKTLEELLQTMLTQALANLPISKYMRWGSNSQQFARPVHWIVLLLNSQIMPVELFGKQSSNFTYGHRFHHPDQIPLVHAKDYEEVLLNVGKVIVDFNKRKNLIQQQAEQIATQAQGQPLLNIELLDLITSIVEYPQTLLGSFNKEFLQLPAEVLIASIQEHQKCMPILATEKNNAKLKLRSHFIIVSNIASTDPDSVIHGNELVMHARLADAAFLLHEDQKQPLKTYIPKLKAITFQAKLGSISEKNTRIASLAKELAIIIGADLAKVATAANLCKADLTTKMVYEFPELQGIMGSYYSLHSGEDQEVALAIREHYLPKSANDDLPNSMPGICLALADRLDSLVGLFAINKIPSGDKDPFALKRQALAILRIIIEKRLSIDLAKLSKIAYANYQHLTGLTDPIEKLQDFFTERLKHWYLANIDSNVKIFSAVQTKQITAPLDCYHRSLAVQAFLQLPEAEALASANKRVKNILAKEIATTAVKSALLTEKAEQDLYMILQQQQQHIEPLLQKAKYTEVLTSLAILKQPIDEFFEHVMVMVDDEQIKQNRLALLQQIRNLFLSVADLSFL